MDGINETEAILDEVVTKLGGTLRSLTYEVFQKALGRAYMLGQETVHRHAAGHAERQLAQAPAPTPTFDEFMETVKG
jgi:hypothetical protein